MRIKRTSALVIIVSSSVIMIVLALTIFGFYAYLEWKETDTVKNYRLSLYDLNARVFNRLVLLNLKANLGTEGALKGKPVIEGTVENISNKKIYSLKLKISFYDHQNRAIYVDRFYPVGAEPEPLVNISGFSENFLGEGDSISFKHPLRNCPREIVDYLIAELNFVKLPDNKKLNLVYKIEGLDIK